MSTSFIGGDSFGFISSGGGGGCCCGCPSEIIVLGGGCNSSVRCASSNTASGAYSTALGQCNTSSGLHSSIVGGFKNTAQSIAGFIGGGNCNFVCNSTCGCLSYGAVVVGGVGNNTNGGTWDLATCVFTVAPTAVNTGL